MRSSLCRVSASGAALRRWELSYHGGTRDGPGRGGAADPGADDVLSGSPDIDDGTIVGEGGPGVTNGGRTNGDNVGRTSG